MTSAAARASSRAVSTRASSAPPRGIPTFRSFVHGIDMDRTMDWKAQDGRGEHKIKKSRTIAQIAKAFRAQGSHLLSWPVGVRIP